MPAFFAKRGTTMPPGIHDDRTDFSHDSTLKMDMTDGGSSTHKRSKRPDTSIIVSIVLLCVLAGMSIAAGTCYVNHMQTIDDIKSWIQEENLGPATATTAHDILHKRQAYSYGHRPSANVTASITANIGTVTTVTTTETGMPVGVSRSTIESFHETAPGIPVTVSPIQPIVNSTITQTVTSKTVYTITPILSSEKHSTLVQTSLQPTTVTVSGTVVPIPASTTTIETAAGVTSAPPSWFSESVGWNLTISSYASLSGTVGTVAKTETCSTSCTDSMGATATSNDAVSATATLTGSLSSSLSRLLSSTKPTLSSTAGPTPTNGSLSTLSTICTDSQISVSKAQSTDQTGDEHTTTITATNHDPTHSWTNTWTVTFTATKTASTHFTKTSNVSYSTTKTTTTVNPDTTRTVIITEPNTSTTTEIDGYSAHGTTTTMSNTLTSTSKVTETVTLTISGTSPALDTCAPVSVVSVTATTVQTVTVMPDTDQITIKGVPTMLVSSFTTESIPTSNAWGRLLSGSNIPLISISPNTTVIVSISIPAITKTVTVGSMSLTGVPTASEPSSTSSLLSHIISDLSTSTYSTAGTPTAAFHTVGTGTAVSMHDTGTPAGTIISSSYTIHANHTSTGVPHVPVSAGSKRSKGPFNTGGPSGSQSPAAGSCVIMLVAIISLLFI